jgi:hypothetical protein
VAAGSWFDPRWHCRTSNNAKNDRIKTMRQRPTPKRSTGSRNTPARQASLQKLTKGTTDTISSLRKAMGFTPQAGSASGTRREPLTPAQRVQAGSATPAKQAGSASGTRREPLTPAQRVQAGSASGTRREPLTPAQRVQVGRGGGGGRPMPPKAGQQAQPIPFGKQGRRSGGMKKR